MNKMIKKILTIAIVSVVIISGVFCYQGIHQSMSHCATDSNSVWCNDFLVHGTIISSAIINTIFVIFSISAFFVLRNFSIKFNKGLNKKKTLYIKTRNKIPILIPINLAIHKGILNPRIP